MTTDDEPWIDVLASADLLEGKPRMIRVTGKRVAFLREGPRIFAFDDLCPHASDPLSQGYPFEGSIVCRAHGWRYELDGGTCLLGEHASRLPIHQVREREGRLEVRLA